MSNSLSVRCTCWPINMVGLHSVGGKWYTVHVEHFGVHNEDGEWSTCTMGCAGVVGVGVSMTREFSASSNIAEKSSVQAFTPSPIPRACKCLLPNPPPSHPRTFLHWPSKSSTDVILDTLLSGSRNTYSKNIHIHVYTFVCNKTDALHLEV